MKVGKKPTYYCVYYCSITLIDGSRLLQALFLLTILVGSVLAGPSIVRHPLHPMSIGKPVKAPGLDLCNLCIQFSSQFLNELVNIIASESQNSRLLRIEQSAWRRG